jgi:manganese/zinc/iron transport system permease protein
MTPTTLWLGLLAATPVAGATDTPGGTAQSLFLDQAVRVISLRDHNTRVVILGTTLLGLTAGVIGSFMLLRKRALVGDVLSHAALPGIAMAFIVATYLGGDGKSLPILLAGATTTSLIGMACILFIQKHTRLKEDVALGVVLSVFFGVGVALLGIIQTMRQGNAAGLESFIYGKTASMLTADAVGIAVAAAVVAVVCALLFKEFGLICFDPSYAASQGWPVVFLDMVLMGLVVTVTVIGLQAVGLILIIALLIIPPAAARFWTDHLLPMVGVSAAIGGASGLLGAALSALTPRLPAGAVIVVVAAVFFTLSMLVGPARGVLVRWFHHRRLKRTVARQHLLRALYESGEASNQASGTTPAPTSWQRLQSARSWSTGHLRHTLAAATTQGLVQTVNPKCYQLTPAGLTEAARVIRNHRLWEIYLITHADIAPSHVDRDADQIEHVLGTQMVQKLESLLRPRYSHLAAVPPSPHEITTPDQQG